MKEKVNVGRILRKLDKPLKRKTLNPEVKRVNGFMGISIFICCVCGRGGMCIYTATCFGTKIRDQQFLKREMKDFWCFVESASSRNAGYTPFQYAEDLF